MLSLFLPIVSSCDAIKLLLAGGVPEHQPDVLTVQTDNKRQLELGRQTPAAAHSRDVCPSHYHLQQTIINSPNSLLQKVHPDGFLVFSSEDSFAIFLDHRGFPHRSIADYDNLDRVQSVYWNKTQGINLYLREPWLWKVLNITTPHMNSFICLNMLNTSKALWTQPSLIMAYNLV